MPNSTVSYSWPVGEIERDVPVPRKVIVLTTARLVRLTLAITLPPLAVVRRKAYWESAVTAIQQVMHTVGPGVLGANVACPLIGSALTTVSALGPDVGMK